MKISKDVIDYYLECITLHWFNDHDDPARNMSEYYDRVVNIKLMASQHNDLEILRLGLDYLLCHPEISLEAHSSSYGWDDDEVRDIIRYIRTIIWPDALEVNNNGVKDIHLTNQSRFNWWKNRDH
jgi:hypothetical protein